MEDPYDIIAMVQLTFDFNLAGPCPASYFVEGVHQACDGNFSMENEIYNKHMTYRGMKNSLNENCYMLKLDGYGSQPDYWWLGEKLDGKSFMTWYARLDISNKSCPYDSRGEKWRMLGSQRTKDVGRMRVNEGNPLDFTRQN